jgi:alkyl hydroperoxide reductase subunit AhpF
MMEARLGVTTCDKCQQPMAKGQSVLIITEGNITNSDDTLTFDGSCVHYACHLDCWDGISKY